MGSLLVSACFQHCGSIAADVLALIKPTRCFDLFSESSWLGLGVEDLMQFVLAALGECQYFIDGFSQYSVQLKKFLAVVSLSSHLPDAVLSILLEDYRIPLELKAFDKEICEVPGATHGRFAAAASASARQSVRIPSGALLGAQ